MPTSPLQASVKGRDAEGGCGWDLRRGLRGCGISESPTTTTNDDAATGVMGDPSEKRK